MPSGDLEPLTPAEAYPRKVFVTPDGAAVLPNYGRRGPPDDVKDRFEARIRRTTIRIPARTCGAQPGAIVFKGMPSRPRGARARLA